MKSLTIVSILALALAGCAHTAVRKKIEGKGACAHMLLGQFMFDSRGADLYEDGQVVLTLEDESKLYLSGAHCVVKPFGSLTDKEALTGETEIPTGAEPVVGQPTK